MHLLVSNHITRLPSKGPCSFMRACIICASVYYLLFHYDHHAKKHTLHLTFTLLCINPFSFPSECALNSTICNNRYIISLFPPKIIQLICCHNIPAVACIILYKQERKVQEKSRRHPGRKRVVSYFKIIS